MHGYMAIMKQLWNNSELADLNISTENLRDQAARIEKSTNLPQRESNPDP